MSVKVFFSSWRLQGWWLTLFLFGASSAHAYLQIQLYPKWAVLLEKESKVYFQECGLLPHCEFPLDAMAPQELLQFCANLSQRQPPVIVWGVGYRNWVAAHYGVAKPGAIL